MGNAVQTLDQIAAPDANEVQVRSRLTGPIETLGFLRRSLLFAELAEISYLTRADAGQMANHMGLPEVRFYDRNGAQAYIFGNEHDAVVVCRGTEPDDENDLRADLDLALIGAETAGLVHRGFKHEVDDLWPRLEQALVNNVRPLWFAGHSLGGAMAAICAGRCKTSFIHSNPRALFTYGSPRIGNGRYVNYVHLEAYRWVNNNDIVTRLPPAIFGYRHKGDEVYLNAYGQLRRVTMWQRAKDRWRGFVQGLRLGELDQVTDHRITRYVEYIRRAVAEDEAVLPMLRPVPQANSTASRRAA